MRNRHYQNPIIRDTQPDPSLCRVGEDYYLCTSTFTGMMLVLYATGNGHPCKAPADFDWCEYKTKETP